MAAVADAGADENTIMFFSSDNGPWLIHLENGGSAGLLRDGKTTTWEGGVRVPGMVRWVGKVVPGISEEVATTYDIFPTVMALAGVPLESDREYDGKDLAPLLMQGAKSPHECTVIGFQ
jgi:arylsulfatase A-like enzyme